MCWGGVLYIAVCTTVASCFVVANGGLEAAMCSSYRYSLSACLIPCYSSIHVPRYLLCLISGESLSNLKPLRLQDLRRPLGKIADWTSKCGDTASGVSRLKRTKLFVVFESGVSIFHVRIYL